MRKSEKIQPIIGLEIHIELKTLSKMFCGCSTDHFGKKPNTQTCPVCLGLPGALPRPNKKAIEWTVLAGLALSCQIPLLAKFDRKNYFYPDLPKGYQISQYDMPFAFNGKFEIRNSKFEIRIRRVHLEEDTAKMIHKGDFTLIDFNRSGVALMEIVTEPDLRSAEDTGLFLKKIQQIVRYLGISEASMEKGQMRCEPTVNLKIVKDKKIFYTPLVEIKNVNSFRFVKKAIDSEIERQWREFKKTGIVKESGNKTTRGWNENQGKTFLQRQKEESSDYRYFPEPDIPPVEWTDKQISNFKFQISNIELPDKKITRFITSYHITPYQANILCETCNKADCFEEAVKKGKALGVTPREIANQMINRRLDLSKLFKRNKKSTFSTSALKKAIAQVLAQNPKAINDYRQGKTPAIEFLVGKVMKQTKGQADPNKIRTLIHNKLDKRSRIAKLTRSWIGYIG